MPDLPGAVAGDGPDAAVPAHYGAPLREQRRLLDSRAVVDFSHLDTVEVSGPDTLKWLHTLSSQALLDAAPGDSRELLILSPNGRIEHACAVLVREDGVLLVTDPGCGAALIAYLERMRFASRVEVQARPDLAAVGSVGPLSEVDNFQPDLAPLAEWDDPWPGVCPGGVAYGPDPEEAVDWRLSLLARTELTRVPAALWAGLLSAEALRVAAHRPRLRREVDERSIPHELDWLRSAVHTAKGCYRGQETVAKVLNLGQPPRRLVLLHLDGGSDLLPSHGDRVTLQGREVGHVTSGAQHCDLGTIALALVRRSVPTDAQLTVVVTAADASAEVPALQEVIVREREHAPRPKTAKL
ncbi:folate-binding protein [Dermabacteraceae bacterium TAE3-ERU27]|nr:folate-binding protein [Dermabacteraceae bacterium TAE3-ERU27]